MRCEVRGKSEDQVRGSSKAETGVSGSDFRDLEVWKKARQLAIVVYGLTADGPLGKDFGLRDQMRRATVSICSNIAEGNDRNSNKDAARFLFMAKGSSAELMAQAEIALGVGYLGKADAERLIANCEEISRMLRGLIKHREKSI
jgi:four helix bundle protein